MKNNMTVMSLPAKPQPKTNIGLMFAPLIMEIIGKKTKSNKMITLNTLHTYVSSQDYVDVYLNDLKNLSIDFDDYYEDSIHSNELLNILKILLTKNIIREKKVEIFSCKCGKVEFIKNGLCFNEGKLYSKNNSNLICNECNSEVLLHKKNALVLNYNKCNEKVRVFPEFLEKEMNYFVELFNDQDILISKTRDTRNYITIDKNVYNIDIEFIWSQLYGINSNNKIMIASNHQVYVMFIINMLNRFYNGNEVAFILTPYMDNSTKFPYFQEKFDDLSNIHKKLFLFYSLNWKKKTCSWDLGTYKKIKRLNIEEANKLFDILCEQIEYKNLDELMNSLNRFFLQESKIDKNIEKMKNLI